MKDKVTGLAKAGSGPAGWSNSSDRGDRARRLRSVDEGGSDSCFTSPPSRLVMGTGSSSPGGARSGHFVRGGRKRTASAECGGTSTSGPGVPASSRGPRDAYPRRPVHATRPRRRGRRGGRPTIVSRSCGCGDPLAKSARFDRYKPVYRRAPGGTDRFSRRWRPRSTDNRGPGPGSLTFCIPPQRGGELPAALRARGPPARRYSPTRADGSTSAATNRRGS